MKRTRRNLAAMTIAIAIAAGGVYGHGRIPQDTPIERIIENIQAKLKENPRDAHAYYILGRAHALAFETKNNNIYAWHKLNTDFEFEPATAGWQHNRFDRSKADVPTEEQRTKHLTEAVRNLNKAIELDPSKASFRLAMASILEAGVDRAGTEDTFPCCPVAGKPADDNYVAQLVKGLG